MDDLEYVVELARWAPPYLVVGCGFIAAVLATWLIWSKLPADPRYFLAEGARHMLGWFVIGICCVLLAALALCGIGIVLLMISWIGAFLVGIAHDLGLFMDYP